jgi:hypothetical protein
VAHGLHVWPLPAREAGHGVAVHGAHVDPQPHRHPHHREAGAPVDKRDVDVERAAMPRLDRQRDPADGQVAVLGEARERGQGGGRGDEHDDGERQRGPDRGGEVGAAKSRQPWAATSNAGQGHLRSKSAAR